MKPQVTKLDALQIALLAEHQADAIRALVGAGYDKVAIAKALGVTPQMLSQVTSLDKVLGRDTQAVLAQLASKVGHHMIALAHLSSPTREQVKRFLDRPAVPGNRATQPNAHGALPVEVQR